MGQTRQIILPSQETSQLGFELRVLNRTHCALGWYDIHFQILETSRRRPARPIIPSVQFIKISRSFAFDSCLFFSSTTGYKSSRVKKVIASENRRKEEETMLGMRRRSPLHEVESERSPSKLPKDDALSIYGNQSLFIFLSINLSMCFLMMVEMDLCFGNQIVLFSSNYRHRWCEPSRFLVNVMEIIYLDFYFACPLRSAGALLLFVLLYEPNGVLYLKAGVLYRDGRANDLNYYGFQNPAIISSTI